MTHALIIENFHDKKKEYIFKHPIVKYEVIYFINVNQQPYVYFYSLTSTMDFWD